ncbi:MAG: polysaccharide pyruvyl transferase CsaB [Clostridiales bacterium]|nr:polysaccharide pyruvyl transferase CsaB [Clostridiales bacterium]
MCGVVISGFYGFENAGDEAILQSMIKELRKADADIKIVVLSANPQRTARIHDVQSVNRSDIYQVLKAIRSCDILISGGGSLLQDATSVFSMWYYSGIILLAFLLKKPVFAYAQGIGPIINKFNIKLLKYIMNRVFNISVRDKRSLSELRSLGVNREVSCTIDPAFLIDLPSRGESLKVLETENGGKKLSRPRIGFSIRKWKGNVDVTGIIAEVGDRVSSELGADVILFPLHYQSDFELAREIANKMQEKPIIISDNHSSSELMGLYGLMDLNVCVRYHGLVFSIMNCTPMVAISYDPKIDSLMDALGMEDVLKYEELNAIRVFNAIKDKWNDRVVLSDRIGVKTEEFKSLAREGIKEVTNLIKTMKKS